MNEPSRSAEGCRSPAPVPARRRPRPEAQPRTSTSGAGWDRRHPRRERRVLSGWASALQAAAAEGRRPGRGEPPATGRRGPAWRTRPEPRSRAFAAHRQAESSRPGSYGLSEARPCFTCVGIQPARADAGSRAPSGVPALSPRALAAVPPRFGDGSHMTSPSNATLASCSLPSPDPALVPEVAGGPAAGARRSDGRARGSHPCQRQALSTGRMSRSVGQRRQVHRLRSCCPIHHLEDAALGLLVNRWRPADGTGSCRTSRSSRHCHRARYAGREPATPGHSPAGSRAHGRRRSPSPLGVSTSRFKPRAMDVVHEERALVLLGPGVALVDHEPGVGMAAARGVGTVIAAVRGLRPGSAGGRRWS